jgi:hypothetical protein
VPRLNSISRRKTCLTGRKSSKKPAFTLPVWVMPAKCSTSRLKPIIVDGFPICARNWKTQSGSGELSVPSSSRLRLIR